MLLSERNYVSFQLSIVLFYFCSIERNPFKDCSRARACVCAFFYFLFSHIISDNSSEFCMGKRETRKDNRQRLVFDKGFLSDNAHAGFPDQVKSRKRHKTGVPNSVDQFLIT